MTISEWTQLGYHEAGDLTRPGTAGRLDLGLLGRLVARLLNSVANNHHAVGRFYETFGNGSAGTFDRDLSRGEVTRAGR